MKKKFLYTSLIFIVVLIFIKILDISVGFFLKRNLSENKLFSRSVNLREHTPLIDKFVIPSQSMLNSSNKLEKRKYRLRTDKDGFIIGENWKDFENKPTDIIFLGGSTTESLYVDEGFRFPYLLSKKITKRDGSNLKIVNGGVAGNNSIHSLINLIAKSIKHNPKYVVLMHNINDLGTLSKTLSYWKGPESRKIVLSKHYNNNKKVYNFFKGIKNFLIPNIWEVVPKELQKIILNKNIDEWNKFRNKKKFLEVKNTFTENFRSSILSFINICKSWNIEPILMTQFNRMNLNDLEIKSSYESKDQPISFEDFVELYDLGNQIIRDISLDQNILLIDLDKYIPPTEDYIYDAAHLTKKGSILVADKIAEELLIQRDKIFRKFD